jgi:heme oxygenase
LGYLYVAEGSTLGGAVIARALAKNTNLASVTNYNFYGCYGENVGTMWKNFIIAMESTAPRLNNNEAIVVGGTNAFEFFGRCLQNAKTFTKAEV